MTSNDMDRRKFVRAAAHGCALLLAGSEFRFVSPRGRDTLYVTLLAGSPQAVVRGVQLGVEEAARTGELMGRGIVLAMSDVVESAGAADRTAAVIGGYDEPSARALARAAEEIGCVFINVGCRANALRGEGCARNMFHVEASDRMYADALAARGDDAARATEAVLWHPSLERFGAAQLNDRFRARFGAQMDGAAWAGWMAVKVLWEASLRARTAEGAGIRAYLERESTQFDGHKGWPLSFRPWDHQLRQPLYLVADARVAGEVPARRGEDGSSRELLDRLGADGSATACRMSG